MTKERQKNLCESLTRLGYGRDKEIRLYGENYRLTSDPIVVADKVVFIDAVEPESGRSRRIRIPLSIIHMAIQNLSD